jgi:hypothetical protein
VLRVWKIRKRTIRGVDFASEWERVVGHCPAFGAFPNFSGIPTPRANSDLNPVSHFSYEFFLKPA